MPGADTPAGVFNAFVLRDGVSIRFREMRDLMRQATIDGSFYSAVRPVARYLHE
jgi:hypothetical protein